MQIFAISLTLILTKMACGGNNSHGRKQVFNKWNRFNVSVLYNIEISII